MKLLAIIPSYNHGLHLQRVVKDIKSYCTDILVVDDGSTDITKNLKPTNAFLIRHSRNRGKGAALKTGFGFAIHKGYDAVLTIDSDGQHKAYDIPQFIKAAQQYDLIIGSRMHNVRNMPLRRRMANSLSSFIVSILSGQYIADSQSGFRLIKTKLLRQIHLTNNGYQLETEIILKAARKGFKIGSVPIETIYGKEASHINPVTVCFRFLKTLIQR
ncbi:MAG TPA: glycosyltransferase family 2 protein [Candidatus Nanoarchaeia archaeon]|nr:glycosyltransferase family 2 protein [Candidatus Nanoarchaeia archaeon]